MKHTALATHAPRFPATRRLQRWLSTLNAGATSRPSSTTEPLMWYVANPAPTVVDFDRDPAQAAIADGTTVDATYASLGVTFTCIVCTSGHAFARSPGRAGNGVSLVASPTIPVYDSRSGAVRADFSTPRSWVSVDVLAVLPVGIRGHSRGQAVAGSLQRGRPEDRLRSLLSSGVWHGRLWAVANAAHRRPHGQHQFDSLVLAALQRFTARSTARSTT